MKTILKRDQKKLETGNLKLDGLVKGQNLYFFTVTSEKVREEFIRKDFIKGLRLNSEREHSHCHSLKAYIRL